MERTRETSIQLGENKEDTYGNRWQTRRIRGPNKHLERRRARERERKKQRKKERKKRKKERRARNGDNKDDKYGNRQWTRSIR